jgi:hypothetical protein
MELTVKNQELTNRLNLILANNNNNQMGNLNGQFNAVADDINSNPHQHHGAQLSAGPGSHPLIHYGNQPIPNGSVHSGSNQSNIPRGVKLQAPKTFDGVKVSGTMVLSFFAQTDHYLTAAGVELNSRESLLIVQTILSGPALLWYQTYVQRYPSTIHNWEDLKVALKLRYYPASQDQQSMNALMSVKYRGNVQEYNNAFQNHANMLPVFNDPNTEKIAMSMYIKGISGSPGTTYMVTTLNSAVQRQEVKTLMELMITASAAEENLKMSRSDNTGTSSNRGGTAAVRVPFGANRFGPTSSYRDASYFNNYSKSTPYPRPFQTPMNRNSQPQSRAANINANELDSQYESELNQLAGQDDENCDSEAETLQIHDDEEHSAESHASAQGQHEVVLNALQQFNKFQRGSEQELSPEEFAQRRLNKACFKCGRQGHFANKCPSTQQPPRKK